jgi:hypothetical protein
MKYFKINNSTLRRNWICFSYMSGIIYQYTVRILCFSCVIKQVRIWLNFVWQSYVLITKACVKCSHKFLEWNLAQKPVFILIRFKSHKILVWFTNSKYNARSGFCEIIQFLWIYWNCGKKLMFFLFLHMVWLAVLRASKYKGFILIQIVTL